MVPETKRQTTEPPSHLEMSDLKSGDRLQIGIEALAQRRFADAVSAIDGHVRAHPTDQTAYAYLGYARAAANDEFVAKIADPGTDGASLLVFARSVSQKLPRPSKRVLRPRPRRPGRLRIGFLSPDFRQHSCAFFLRSLFERRDRAQFEFHCFADFQATKFDALSERFRASADKWTETTRMNMPELAACIAEAAIDVLVDVGGYSFGSTAPVCAYKPARKIVTWLGFPASTGMPEIDYRFGDSASDPEGPADAHFSERIVRLDGPFLCYTPDVATPPPAPVPGGDICFGTFNALHKINIETARLWIRILDAVPNSRLLLKCNLKEDPAGEAFLRGMFAAAGLAGERLTLLDFTPDLRTHLDTYSRMHISLDTMPYNGTTTTCEALWMGVPVVALRGKRHSACVSASLLHHAGLGELIAETPDEYVAKAAALANDPARLQGYRSMRERLAQTPLYDAERWVRIFEAGLLKVFSDRPDPADGAYRRA
jgi:protein O-GlcNAc transferase